MKILKYLAYIIVISIVFTFIEACYIQGTDSGSCDDSISKYPITMKATLPFCSQFITYPACLPTIQSIPPSRDFPNRRWINHTALTKDTWVWQMTEQKILERRRIEKDESLINAGVDEYGDPAPKGKVVVRFWHKPDCMHAFRAYACFINFPRCDMAKDLSLPTCRSACENFFKSCGYEQNLWRCGPSKYFNGYTKDFPPYLRDYFPGQPFRANKFDFQQNPVVLCTPSVLGAATSSHSRNILITSLLTFIITITFCF